MRSIRIASEKEGMAEIDEMREQVRGTRNRAQATVAALRTEANSVSEETDARVTEVLKEIETVRERSQAPRVSSTPRRIRSSRTARPTPTSCWPAPTRSRARRRRRSTS
jgi:vacuolar-type H+-ATPase subunit I/STV1